MAHIRPFAALRPRDDLAPRVASVPYDVINSEEARALSKGNEYSFLHVCRSEIDLDPTLSPYDERVYAQSRENLDRFIKQGILRPDSKPCFYLYRQQMGAHIQTGLVALTSVEEYDRNLIRKHEKTRADKEDDRTRAILALSAHSEPVFLSYRPVPQVDALVKRITTSEKPVNRFVSPDDIEHTLWIVSLPTDQELLQHAFTSVPVIYIADGHHRSASASRVRAYYQEKGKVPVGADFFLSVLFPDNQLSIMPYNRVVKDLNGLSPDAFLKVVRERFNVTENALPAPASARSFSMYLGGRWMGLAVRPADCRDKDPIASLDVSLLQDRLLSPVLGIGDPRTDKRIDFVGGIRGTEELVRLVDSGQFVVAFSLYPVRMEQIMAIADAGGIMPPKSTWFEPKLRSGLFSHVF